MSAATLLPKLKRFRRLLGANANRAYWGPDATLSAWPCAVTGTVATAGGSGLTLGSMNGVQCPVFGGAAWYRTGVLGGVAGPILFVVVAAMSGSGVNQWVIDGMGANTYALFRSPTTNDVRASVGASFGPVTNPPGTSPFLALLTASGSASSLTINDGTAVTGGVGAGTTFTGLTIGQRGDAGGIGFFSGRIPLVAIVYGTNYAARAATIASGARALIGV